MKLIQQAVRVKITSISAQKTDPNRVNISVDGKYRFSLDVSQVVDLGINIGQEFDEEGLSRLEGESQFGKVYAKALEYCLMRPHSAQEVKDYLRRKTMNTRYKSRTGKLKDRPGISPEMADSVFSRLQERGYIDDEKFARWWIENRNIKKGVSRRKLQSELLGKGISPSIIDAVLADSHRNDDDELRKVINKKSKRYDDPKKFIQYLMRQGFSYDDVKRVLASDESD